MLAPFERKSDAATPGDAEPASVAPPEVHETDLVWRCTRCGYQRLSAEPPERCAGCDAGRAELVGRTAIEWRFLLRHARDE